MAITKLLRMKEAKGKNKAGHLKRNIFYICNPDKCEGGLLIGGNAGSTPKIIYETMMENKKLWGKEFYNEIVMLHRADIDLNIKGSD